MVMHRMKILHLHAFGKKAARIYRLSLSRLNLHIKRDNELLGTVCSQKIRVRMAER